MERIKKLLLENADEEYRNFHSKLIPTVDVERILGVRVPILRKIAKTILREYSNENLKMFLSELPHEYYDEDMLHALLVSEFKDFDEALALTNEFLPYIDNWAVCDMFCPKCFKLHKSELWQSVTGWLNSDSVYTVRYGIVTSMRYFLDEDFSKDKFDMTTSIVSDEYYVRMAVAWYISFALIKQWGVAIELLKSKTLDKWLQNKSIQKAVESYRLTVEQKLYLKTLKL